MHYVSPEHCVVAFDGVDALAFLQSQLTNDVAALAIGEWQWQGYCNAKGRLHATFALVRTAEATFLAVVHTSTTPFLVKRLSMFRLRSKLTIAIDESLAAIHYFTEPASRENVRATIGLGHGRWVTIEPKVGPKALNEQAAPTPDLIGRWKTIGIKSRQPEVVLETNEMFVPQMIAFDTVAPRSGVSFSKGCYPGQEVVARAHYRGAVKRRLAVETVAFDAAPGKTIVRPDGQKIDIVNVAQVGNAANAVALIVEPIPAA